MKKETHPQYYPEAKVTCVCGATYLVGSTMEKINVEICRACHPFFTGQTKMIDTAGRVEKFEKRRAKSAKK
jgi:large subunit ribosomal protein L31